jgi:uncharacterized membrane protein YqhA
MTNLFGYTRYIVLIAVISLLLASLAVFIFAGVATINIIIESFTEGEFNAEGGRLISIELIEMIDLFLLGTILLITSIGLYQLFIQPDMDLPEWIVVTNLEQLKFNLLAVIIVMLAILFLGAASDYLVGSDGILGYGLAIAGVVAAIALAVWVFNRVFAEEEEQIHERLQEAGEQQHD